MGGGMRRATLRSDSRKCVLESPSNPETPSRSVRGGLQPSLTNSEPARAAKPVLLEHQAPFFAHEPQHIFETAEARTHKAAVNGCCLRDRVVQHRTEAASAPCPARCSQPCSQRKLQCDGAEVFGRQLQVNLRGLRRPMPKDVADRLEGNGCP